MQVYDVAIVRDTWNGQRLNDLNEEMTDMWREVIDHIKADGVLGTDLCRIHIGHRNLGKGDIKVPLQRFRDLSPATIIDRIDRVMQSHYNLKIDDVLEISVGIIRFPRTRGRHNHLSVSNESLKNKTSLVVIDNDDSKCLPRSLAVCQAWESHQAKRMPRHLWRNFCDSKSAEQTNKADEIIKSVNLCHEECSNMANIPLYEDYLKANIVVVSASHMNGIIYPADPKSMKYDTTYYLYYVDSMKGITEPGHFHAIKTMTGMLSMAYFCAMCNKGYTKKSHHSCWATCEKCKSPQCLTEPVSKTTYSCDDCRVEFRSKACYDRHKECTLYTSGKKKGQAKSRSVCEKYWQCDTCYQYFESAKRSRTDHRCHEHFCRTCSKWACNETHKCYIRRPETKKPRKKMIIFDFECTQESGQHVPNLVVAQVHDLESGEMEPYTCRSDNVQNEFGTWLFSEEHKGAVVLAHNLKSYDGYFLLDHLVTNGIKHEVIYSGSKIMSINVKNHLNMKLVDSLNFFPMPLSMLPKTFGLDGFKKGDFPHLFNVEAHYDYVGPYPDVRYYGVESMKSEHREEFLAWYETKKTETFNFESELLAYCENDVEILSQACLMFREKLLDISGIDPFNHITIASTTMAVFKENFLEEHYEIGPKDDRKSVVVKGELQDKTKTFTKSNLALVPATGYVTRDNYSRESIIWLEWMQHHNPGMVIHHALSGEGEYRVPGTNFRADGYVAETKTIYEYMGCLYHGCPECYPCRNTTLPKTNETAALLHFRTMKRLEQLEDMGYNVVTIWGHQFREEMKVNTELQTFAQRLDVESRLYMRDSFYGGRTNATKLHYKAGPNEKIRYVDFTSLYPYVNKYSRYPVGHPTIITRDFEDIDHYFGMAKVCYIIYIVM